MCDSLNLESSYTDGVEMYSSLWRGAKSILKDLNHTYEIKLEKIDGNDFQKIENMIEKLINKI